MMLLDIEGTVGSISFVHDVLFPIAYQRMESFIKNHRHEIKDIYQSLINELQSNKIANPTEDDVILLLRTWIQEDKKETRLKEIQGRIWHHAFSSNQVQSHLYPDAVSAMKRWKERGKRISIFSSGSVFAQKMYFKYTEYGDLSSYIDHYFDTTTGPKKETETYLKIASFVNCKPSEITFFSDVFDECFAAEKAGINAIQIFRDTEITENRFHPIKDFNGIA